MKFKQLILALLLAVAPAAPVLAQTKIDINNQTFGNLTQDRVVGGSLSNPFARTGVDINSSFQVTALHLTNPLACSTGNFATGIDASGNAICGTPAGTGTVTAVSKTGSPALSPLFDLSITNPTSTPNFIFSLLNAGGNTVFANCTGSSAAPTFCGLTPAMIPNNAANTTGQANTAVALSVNPTACSANQFVNDTDANGTLHCAQPAYAGISGTPTIYYQSVKVSGGTSLTQQPIFNFIPGSNITITCVNNGGTTSTDCTWASTAGGGNVTATSLTTNRYSKASGATAVADACLSDDGTTVTNNCSGGFVTGTSGTDGGVELPANSTQTVSAATNARIIANGNKLKVSENGGTFVEVAKVNSSISGNSATASAFDHNPAGCTNQLVNDIAADGTLSCHTVTTGDTDNTLAKTGSDINTINNVTATHLASPLPSAQGGFGSDLSAAAIGRYVRASALGVFSASSVAAGGAGACTNQAVTATNDNAAPTCNTLNANYVDSTSIHSVNTKADVIESGLGCTAASASGTAYTCSISPAITAYTTRACYILISDVANTGATTWNLNALGAKSVVKRVGSSITTALTANDIGAGAANLYCYDGTNLELVTAAGGVLAAAQFPAQTGDVVNPVGTVANTIQNGVVTAAKMAAQYSKGTCSLNWVGSGTSAALVSGDDVYTTNSCYNDSAVTRTITAVKCRSSAASNTTTINPTFGAAGTGTTILSGALTCGSSYAMSSTGTVSNASWTTGTGIAPAMGGTLTGTSVVMIVEFTY